MTMMHRRRPLLPTLLSILLATVTARRGALVKDGMSSKSAYDNPALFNSGDATLDPDVVAITTRCSKWSVDPIDCDDVNGLDGVGYGGDVTRDEIKSVLGKGVLSTPLHVTLRSRPLTGGKRPNWMRATAFLGDPAIHKSKSIPVRAVWTCSNADADTSMTFEQMNAKGRVERKEIGANVLEDGYEDCVKRVYGKYVELEVLLPRSKGTSSLLMKGGPPPSVVYRVPIRTGGVNPLGMVAKSRATVTLYPRGRTLAAASASGPNASAAERDVAIPLGLSNVHLPLGPGLVDPSWAKGRKLFWKGRSVGLV